MHWKWVASKIFLQSNSLHWNNFALKKFCNENVCNEILAFKLLQSKSLQWDHSESIKLPLQMVLTLQWHLRSQQNLKICILTKFHPSVLIVALSAPIFGVRLVNKVPHLVGIFKNQQRGAMRHGPNANCTNFYSILTKSKTTFIKTNERAGAHGHTIVL